MLARHETVLRDRPASTGVVSRRKEKNLRLRCRKATPHIVLLQSKESMC